MAFPAAVNHSELKAQHHTSELVNINAFSNVAGPAGRDAGPAAAPQARTSSDHCANIANAAKVTSDQ